MRILLTPCRSDEKINYEFNGETITVLYKGMEETIDLSAIRDEEDFEYKPINLTINPIINAKRIDGVLHVELLSFIGVNASYEERFPDWIDV